MSNITFEFDLSEITDGIEQMGKDIEKVEKTATLEASRHVAEKLKENTPRSDISKAEYKHLQDNVKVGSLREDKETLDKSRHVSYGKLQYKANWLNDGTSKMRGKHHIEKTVNETKNDVANIVNEHVKKELGL